MKIHLIGIGGAAMGNLAAMLKQSGHKVSGSDQDLYPPMSDRLKEWKIDARPFNKSSVKGKDLVIAGNAISRGNVELEETLRLGLPITSMAAALQQFFLKGRKVVVVAGTHGKTTTTFLTDYLLGEAAALASRSARSGASSSSMAASSVGHGSARSRRVSAADLPGLFVGGVRADGHPGFRIPGKNNPYFVIEGDEYDTAFFDKASKFLHYRPHYLILTSVEYDHADIFENFEQYKKSFRILLRWIPPNGALIPCMADAGVREVCKEYRFSPVLGYGKNSLSYGKRKGADVRFKLRKPDGRPDLDFECTPSLIGQHNTFNATAAALLARQAGISQAQIIAGLESFPGVLRRQQVRISMTGDQASGTILAAGSSTGIGGRAKVETRERSRQKKTVAASERIFMEDFAHHPTAVKQTLDAVREAYPGYTIIALYEPRSATSHRSIFEHEYVDALQDANTVLLPDVFNRKKVSSDVLLDVKSIVRQLQQRGVDAHFCKDPAGVLNALKKQYALATKTGAPVLILGMSNGGFGGIYPEIDDLVKG
tara:strand:- start:2476 stop:4098 length:1623 start_codon:yes stop_codon:yes gene_type:complete